MSIDNSMGTLSPMATLAPAGKGTARPGDAEQDSTDFASLLQTLEEQDDTPAEKDRDRTAQAATKPVIEEDKTQTPPAAPQAEGLVLTPAWLQVNQLLQARAPGQPGPGGAGSTGPTSLPTVIQTSVQPPSASNAPIMFDTSTPAKPGGPLPARDETPVGQATAPALAEAEAEAKAKATAAASARSPEMTPLDQAATLAEVLSPPPSQAATLGRVRASTATGSASRSATPSAPQAAKPSTAGTATEERARLMPAPATPHPVPASGNASQATAAQSGRERGPIIGGAALAGETVAALQPLLDAAAQAASATLTPARQAGPSASSGGEGAWGAQALLTERHVETSAPTAPTEVGDAGQAASAQDLNEQIGYWIGNEIQSAHVQIDQDAQDPVQISVSLQGDEAHVRFQVESPEIRRVLEGTTTDLRDLLRAQGLELAGVSIDAAGTPDTGARDADGGNPREGQRDNADNAATAPARPQTAPRLPGNGSHRLDVFV